MREDCTHEAQAHRTPHPKELIVMSITSLKIAVLTTLATLATLATAAPALAGQISAI